MAQPLPFARTMAHPHLPSDARTSGKLWIHGGGRVEVGRRVFLDAARAPIELHALPGATIRIGEDSYVGPGTSIEATSSIAIGARCQLGEGCKVMDNHFHPLRGDRHARPAATPVVLEDDAEVGARAILLPGARVGHGSKIAAGTVLRRPIPPGVTLPGRQAGSGHEVPRVAVPRVDVSVVIPTYRRPALLVEAIRSALGQEDVDIEIIVVDDSPEASARDAVTRIADPRVRYFHRETPSLGRPSIVRNDGWPEARGRYVHFLDDDDLVVPGAYAAHVTALDDRPRCAMSFGIIEPFGEEGPALARERRFWEVAAARARTARRVGRAGVVAMLLGAVLFQNSACMVRKRALEESGGFDPLMDMQEDTELHLRTVRERGCVFLDRVVVRYRLAPDSLIHDVRNAWKIDRAHARLQRKYRDAHGSFEFMALKILGKAERLLSPRWSDA